MRIKKSSMRFIVWVLFISFYCISFLGVASCQELYINKHFGFEMQYPKGWSESKETQLEDGSIQVYFSKDKAKSTPGLIVSTDSLGNFENYLEYTNFVIGRLREVYAKANLQMKVLAEPREVEIHGLRCIRYIYEVSGPVTMKYIEYRFIRRSAVFSITGFDRAVNFDNSINDFEKMVASFKLYD